MEQALTRTKKYKGKTDMKNLKNILNLTFVAVFILSSVSLSIARDNTNRLSGPLRKVAGTPISTMVNINNLAVWFRADGWSARNPATGNSGGMFPRGNPVGVIFADGLVWSGLVQDGQSPVLRAGGQTFAIGTVPGRIISKGVAEDPNAADVRIWRIRRDFATANLRPDAADIFTLTLGNVTETDEARIREQYSKDWLEWPAEKGAPFYDSDDDGIYTPKLNTDGTPVLFPDADEPGLADADQVVWFVANDLSPGATAGLYGSPPIGIEMQASLWGYARTDALGFVVFKRYRLIYKGTEDTPDGATVDSMFFAQWVDPDLGSAGDDFVGNDPDASLGYVYNSGPVDSRFDGFGLPPPAAGYDFFAGPIIESPGDTAIFDLKRRPGYKNLGMSSFAFFAAGTAISDPPLGTYEGTLQWRNLHKGLTPAGGVTFFDPNDPVQSACGPFTLCGDPVTGEGWIDSSPSDRRMVLNTGPFTMALGDTQEITLALIAALGQDYLSSISRLRAFDVAAQQAFDDLFELAKAPPSPKFTLSGLDQKILVNWGEDLDGVAATEDPTEKKGFVFEGYNVYQLRTASSTLADAVKLATFDLNNGVKTILSPQIDEASGEVVLIPAQIGFDTGLERFLVVTEDAVKSGPIINSRSYFFAVTAYNFNDTTDAEAIHALESPLSVRSIIPQPPKPGLTFTAALGDTVAVTHTAGASDGTAAPIVLDPALLTGDSYEVTFNSDFSWNLKKGSEVVVNSNPNQSGDGAYPILDGFQIKVAGPPLEAKSWSYAEGSGLMERWFSGAGGGGEILFGAVFLDVIFWGNSLTEPADYKTVEIRYGGMSSFEDGSGSFGVVNGEYDFGETYTVDTNKPNQNAFMYKTWGAGQYEGFLPVPFEAWDVTADPPRQLNIFLRDWSANAADYGVGQWDLSFVGDGEPFEYTWIMATDYDPTGTIYNPDAGGIDLMHRLAGAGEGALDAVNAYFTLWMGPRGSRPFLADDGVLTLEPNKVNSTGDIFTFTTPAAPASTPEQAEADVALINVFPNPYLGFSSLETNRFNRYVRFTHLPQEVTIRIFNLAGVHVRTLKKEGDDQLLDWDLKNENELPVASGIYIAFLSDMKDVSGNDLGEKILKLAIVIERQFLENF